jgi:hypothetical protein
LRADNRERAHGVGAADTIGRRATVRLELLQSPRSFGAEDAVDTAAIETEAGQPGLQFGHVVASKVRRSQEQQAIAELPAGLDQGCPGLLVTSAVAAQAAPGLKGADGSFSGTTKSRRLGGGGRKPGGTEAALQIAYGLAALTGCQREVGRNSSSS